MRAHVLRQVAGRRERLAARLASGVPRKKSEGVFRALGVWAEV